MNTRLSNSNQYDFQQHFHSSLSQTFITTKNDMTPFFNKKIVVLLVRKLRRPFKLPCFNDA